MAEKMRLLFKKSIIYLLFLLTNKINEVSILRFWLLILSHEVCYALLSMTS